MHNFAKLLHISGNRCTFATKSGRGRTYPAHTHWSMIPETLAFAPLGIGIVPYQLLSAQGEPEGMTIAAMQEVQRVFNLPTTR